MMTTVSRSSGRWVRRSAGAGAALALLVSLSGCGGDGTDAPTKAAEGAVEAVTGDSKAELKGSSALDAAAYGVTRVMSQKFSDYEIDGDTVRLVVRDGVELSGSECTIIRAATQADHPDVTFVLLSPNGEETPC